MCLLSHGVTIFRGNEHIGYPFLRKPFKVTMISCAAPRAPCLALDGSRGYRDASERTKMEDKVAAILQAVVVSGCDAAVLSAFGCGAFRHPPELVAEMFHEHLAHLSPHSGLKQVTFCIVNDHNSRKAHNPVGNVIPFSNVFSEAAYHFAVLRGQAPQAREPCPLCRQGAMPTLEACPLCGLARGLSAPVSQRTVRFLL